MCCSYQTYIIRVNPRCYKCEVTSYYLIKELTDGFKKAQDEFTNHPDRFSDMEKTVADLSRKTAAEFLSMTLTQTDEILCNNRG